MPDALLDEVARRDHHHAALVIEQGASHAGWAPVGFFVIVIGGCGSTPVSPAPTPHVEPSESAAALRPAPSASAPSPAIVPAPATIDWRTGVDELERARRDGRPAMAWFGAAWSASSVALGRRLEASEAVRRAAGKVIAVRVDLTETSEEHEALAARYAVDHVPTVVVVDRRGRTARLEGEIAVEELVEMLERATR